MGGTSDCNGRLEMNLHGEWRAVLAWFDWNRMSSSVACRQLDCGSAVSTEFTTSSTPEPGWMIPSSCVGSETSLVECGLVKAYNATVTLRVSCSGKTRTSTMLTFCDDKQAFECCNNEPSIRLNNMLTKYI